MEDFSVLNGPTKDLGDNVTAKKIFNQFFDDDCFDEIVCYTIECACSKGDKNFTTNIRRPEVSLFLGLNILIRIHELAHVCMYWDSD